MKVTFFDVEYANIRNKSICQIGILSKDLANLNAKIEKIDMIINPDDGYDENCTRIHGITADLTKNAPLFKDIWGQIEPFFTNSIVIGHNIAMADLDALQKNADRYGILLPQIYYLCTYDLARLVIPAFLVPDYSLNSLCSFFNIPEVNHHNAFFDACACSDLLDKLVLFADIDLEKEIKLFTRDEANSFITYVSNPTLKYDIHSLYGVVTGFAIDSIVTEGEKIFLKNWKNSFLKFKNQHEINKIITIIDNILEDNVVTRKEIILLKNTIKQLLDIVNTAPVTLATQILNGIIKGIIEDGEVTEFECENLRDWLYENNYLVGHFPFDRLYSTIERVLEDETLLPKEAEEVKNLINELLNPLYDCNNSFSSLKGKKVCLTGNFAFGEKSAVEQFVIQQGGEVSSVVDESTDILLVGNVDGEKASINQINSTVEKALKCNKNGCGILISKEIDIIVPTKAFKDVLWDLMVKKNLKEPDVYNYAQVSRQLMSNIRNRPNYIPTKQTICALTIAMKLSLEEICELLKAAGYALSRSFEFDRIIEDSIRNGKYDIFDINEKLYDLGIHWLGDK
ncbi:MAG: hypothetical protein IKJ19_03330 [Clostridia bacterium]|nr:hypothetical protein [Clostridia bacterium]